MKASDLFVKCLEEEGIEYIFGVPGEENADFMMSLEDSDKIRFILTRHEQGAAFMAEIYGRLTGNPAGCLGTLGPGATNLITGVADANMDRAPMLVLTGQGATQRLHKESHQVMDVVGMFEPVTKWAETVRHPDTIPEIIRKAIRLARTEKPGAVHIELAEDIAKLDAMTQPITPRRFRRPVPDDKIVDRAFEMLKKARKPVILAGNGCIRKRASKQLRQFCEKTGIGVISTFMAKGAVDMDADYCLYTVGLGSKDRINLVLDEADLVLTLGFDMVEYHPRLWNPNSDKHIVHADFSPTEIDQYYHPEVEIVGDLAHMLWMFNERVDREDALEFDLTGQRKFREEMWADLSEHKDDATKECIRPQKALWDARQVLGAEDILLSDVGAHKMWVARHYHCHEPNTCLIPNGFCSMGFALPGAIAASMVYPERRVLAVCGDGGFLMNVQEMETAKRLDCNMVVMVWQDGGYGLIAWKQQNEFHRHTDLAFGNPDWMQLAEAFGWGGHFCSDAAKLQATLENAFNESGPSLVVIPIDYRPVFYTLATLHEENGDIEAAVEIYEKILALDYHHQDVETRLVRLRDQLPPALAGARSTQENVSGPTLAVNSQSGRYEIVGELGRGGMGIVYKAKDTVLDRLVAFKVLPDTLKENPQALKNFLREAKAAAKLNHPNIVTVYDTGEQDGRYYIAMEYVDGTTLKEILRRRGAISPAGVLHVMVQICEALHYAHEKKVVHRDIKTANTMWTRDKKAKIMDFGLAKVVEEVLNHTTVVSGTPYYMSPEQTLGRNVDHRTDIYSLGVTLFELVTGQVPFKEGNIPYHHVHTPPPEVRTLCPEVPEALACIIDRCLQKDASARYQSAREILEEVRSSLAT